MSELSRLFAQVFDSLQIALASRVWVGLAGFCNVWPANRTEGLGYDRVDVCVYGLPRFRNVWPANRTEGLGYDRVDVCVFGLARVSLIAELTAVSCLGLRLGFSIDFFFFFLFNKYILYSKSSQISE